MSIHSFKLPPHSRKHPHQKLEYWHACKIDHLENGILIHKQCRRLSDRDLIQLARDAAKYVFFHYPWFKQWSKEITLEKLADAKRKLFIKFENQNTSVEIKLLPLEDTDLIAESTRKIKFRQEFQKYFLFLQTFKST